MGITNPNSFLWRTKNINWKVQHDDAANPGSTATDSYPVVQLLQKLHSQRCDTGLIARADRPNPGVAFDANAIGHKHRSRAIQAIGEAVQSFVQKGIDVTIVFDGKYRHQSKRDAIRRRANGDKDQVQLVQLRSQLLANGEDPDATDEDESNAEEIAIKIRRLESAAVSNLPSNFAAEVQTHLQSISTQFTGKITYIGTPYQADPSLARLALNMEVEAVVTTDSDFAMYVGPGADGISDVMLKPEVVGNSIRSCQLSTSQSSCKAFIDSLGHEWANLPKHPFFDQLEDPKVRALLALAVGCDANPGGAYNFGASKVSQLITPGATFEELVDRLSNNFGCKKEDCKEKHSHVHSPAAWRCLVNSILFEPTKAGPLHSEPTQLETYNSDYGYMGTATVPGPLESSCISHSSLL